MSAVLERRIAVIPYYKEKVSFPVGFLAGIFHKLVDQGIDKEFLHNGGMTESEFVEFADKVALTSIFLDMSGSCAGFAWLTNVEETDTLKKGLGAFAFFREYWKPELTEAFGNICLGQWFNVLEYDLVYGVTPVPNRPARHYCKRIGFEYSARIPGFVSYHGKTVDAMVATMTRQQFNAKG